MNPDWISALVALALLVVTLLGALLTRINGISREVADLKTHVAETYATKDEMKDLAERVERQIETGFNRMIEMLKQGK